MAHSVPQFEKEYTYDPANNTLTFQFDFPFSKQTDVKVSVQGVDLGRDKYIINGSHSVTLVEEPDNGEKIRIYRESEVSELPVVFFPGSAIKSKDLNDNFNQTLYVTQELTTETNEFDEIIKKYVVDDAILQGAGGEGEGAVKGLAYAVDLAEANEALLATHHTHIGPTESDGLRADVKQLQDDVGELNQDGQSITGDGLLYKVEVLNLKMTAAEAAIEDAESDIDDAEGDITTLESTVSGHTTQLGQLSSAISSNDSELSQLSSAISSNDSELSGLTTKTNEHDTKIQDLEDDAALKNEINIFESPQIGQFKTITHSTADADIEFNLTQKNHFIVNVNAAWGKFKFTNIASARLGATGSIILKYDGTHTGGKDNHMIFNGGGTPSFSSGSGKIDRIDYIVFSTTQVLCNFTADYRV